MVTPGGVIRGYWATGRLKRAIPPIRVMTTDSTVAKIGRSMKKRANIPGPMKRDEMRGARGEGRGARGEKHEWPHSSLTARASPLLLLGERKRWRVLLLDLRIAAAGAPLCRFLSLGAGWRVGRRRFCLVRLGLRGTLSRRRVRSRRAGQRRHRGLLRLDFHTRADLLQSAHDNQLLRLETLRDDA